METKELPASFELKELNESKGEFEGHAAVFNQEDDRGDIILPGAFTKSLHKHPKQRVKMLLEHDTKAHIGRWDEIREDETGLFVKGHLLPSLTAAKEALVLLKEGMLDSMSIGFRTITDRFDTETRTRSLLEIALFEISLVSFPAQEAALVTSVKHLSPEEITTKRELENALRDAGFSKAACAYISAGWSPPARRDAEGTELVKALHALTKTMKTATGVTR